MSAHPPSHNQHINSGVMALYPLFKPLLFRLEAERAHHAVTAFAAVASHMPGFQTIGRGLFQYRHPALTTKVWGMDFQNPIGLAAGFDKNATLPAAMLGLGFGFVEMGTVTPLPQPGNPTPRLFRLSEDEALINRMGFNNQGAAALAGRLAAFRKRYPNALVGVNLGKNKDTPLESATEDYLKGMETVYPFASYLVVNVSSPNTPGLRNLQSRKALEAMCGVLIKARKARLQKGEPNLPLLIKLAPDLKEAELEDVVGVAMDQGVDGLIATNTTVGREGLKSASREENGGLSGSPLRNRAVEVVGRIHRISQGRLPLVGVGGVFSARDAYAHIQAGASLVQVYTGLVYRGPGLVKDINKGLVTLLERDGFNSVEQAVGSAQ